MNRIYKYPLRINEVNSITMPFGAVVLTVQEQDGLPTVWALVDPGRRTANRLFKIYGTGHLVPTACGAYVGTVQIDGFVWHVFDEGEQQ